MSSPTRQFMMKNNIVGIDGESSGEESDDVAAAAGMIPRSDNGNRSDSMIVPPDPDKTAATLSRPSVAPLMLDKRPLLDVSDGDGSDGDGSDSDIVPPDADTVAAAYLSLPPVAPSIISKPLSSDVSEDDGSDSAIVLPDANKVAAAFLTRPPVAPSMRSKPPSSADVSEDDGADSVILPPDADTVATTFWLAGRPPVFILIQAKSPRKIRPKYSAI